MATADSGGLPVNGVDEVARAGCFTGVHFDGVAGKASMSSKRLCRLRYAILELLKVCRIDSRRLLRLLGHYTYAALLKREMLSILSTCYAFCSVKSDQVRTLWGSARRELRWAAALLPMVYAALTTPRSAVTHASDASGGHEQGFGVCSCWTGSDWARLHALGSYLDPTSLVRDPASLELLDTSEWETQRVASFPEALRDRSDRPWKLVARGRFERPENILRLDGARAGHGCAAHDTCYLGTLAPAPSLVRQLVCCAV